ncbi:recombinase RecT [Pseudooceanicola sp. CBS1P-1]|uniref:Recombinase RecT n=1 Tax=Pseudooceanicola albus TaxID=2692189 RepID=A0A6L7G4Z0_9RHOB|nr:MULTISPECIES: Rmf/CrpP family protein [Pseudooceanicola]MBT9385507.1 recombinase RecT [Pseudooceanicola endophyticus]MXN19081.1 hypothetical protein [Pseudooceanicola albus]
MNDLVTFKRNLGDLIAKNELALPSNVTSDAFRNAAVIAAQDNPKILTCDQASVFKSIRTLAAAGLVPDGREAALVPFRTKDGEKCQAMPMVFGLIKMVRRSGTVKDIRAHIVYQREVDDGRFTYVVGDDERLEHNPILFGDRGPAVGTYAIATLTDGSKVREFMAAEDVDKVRRAGSSQKVYEKGKRPTVSEQPLGIWKDWSEEMWKKTVIRRLCKRLDMSSEDMRRVMVDEDSIRQIRDITPSDEPKTGFAAKAAAARQQAEEQDQQQDDEGDTIEGQVAGDDSAPEPDPNALEFAEGRTAAEGGEGMDACPYEDGQQRMDWTAGWFEAQSKEEEA